MRFDLNLRQVVKQQIIDAAEEMKAWDTDPSLKESERDAIRQRIRLFEHTTKRDNLRLGGVDGSGDFPAFKCFVQSVGSVPHRHCATGLDF